MSDNNHDGNDVQCISFLVNPDMLAISHNMHHSASPHPSFVSAVKSSTAHSPIVSSLSVLYCLETRFGWKQFFRSSEFRLQVRGDSVSASVFGARDPVCQNRWKAAMADSRAMAAAGGRPAQEFTFVNKKGLKLKGLLVDGGAGSKEVCILCHGFRSSKLGSTLRALSTGLAEAGVSTFRFDFSGNGESEGQFAYGNYWQEVEDLRAAVEFWTSKGSRVVCVAGHSKGGNCVVLYASKYHDVPCVINISGRFALEKGQWLRPLPSSRALCCRYLILFGLRM